MYRYILSFDMFLLFRKLDFFTYCPCVIDSINTNNVNELYNQNQKEIQQYRQKRELVDKKWIFIHIVYYII